MEEQEASIYMKTVIGLRVVNRPTCFFLGTFLLLESIIA